MKFEIDLPCSIRFGRGCRFELPSLLPEGNVLFVCGKHSVPRIENEMRPLLQGREVFIRAPFAGEPALHELEELLTFARANHVSAVVGWGGGSAMDGAKAAAALLFEVGSVEDFFYNRRVPGERKCFYAALPTTAGTGAEVTANAVLTDHSNGIKQSLRTPGMAANAALVDPELIEECPFDVMAASGFDALTQAVESFISRKADTLTRALARSAVRDIFLNLAGACEQDPRAVDSVALGSLNAGIAFSRSGLGAVHGIGHPVGSLLHVPHGVCCGILLVEVLKFNLPAVRELLDELASGAGAADADALIGEISRLREKLGVPANFRQYGLKEEDYPFIVKNCRSGSMKSNPRDMSDEEVVQLLEKVK